MLELRLRRHHFMPRRLAEIIDAKFILAFCIINYLMNMMAPFGAQHLSTLKCVSTLTL